MKTLKAQRGVALLIVLMIVALVSVLATTMGTRLQLQVQRTANIKDNNQAYWYAMGAEAFAGKSLKQLLEESADTISIDQPWAQEFIYPVDNGQITARLEDMQSCFNVNALPKADANQARQQSVTPAMEAFHRMLLESGLEMDSYTADTFRDSLADWLDEDDQMRPYGAEDSEYESKEFPYLAANGKMSSQSELRLIKGVQPQWLNKILPLVCVIPSSDSLKINVNTLTPERAAILAGLTGMTLSQAKSLISSRPRDGWEDLNQFFGEPDIAALSIEQDRRDWFSVSTEYFMLHTKTRYNKATFTLTTVFHAQTAGVSVLRREFGGIE